MKPLLFTIIKEKCMNFSLIDFVLKLENCYRKRKSYSFLLKDEDTSLLKFIMKMFINPALL